MTDEFCEEEMHALIISESFGEGLTDATGMVCLLALSLLYILTCLQGIDIPDIQTVLQYATPKSSTHGGRGLGGLAMTILLML